MLTILMASVAPKQSRTVSSPPRSAEEQGCRGWEGARPGRQPELAMEMFHAMGSMLSWWRRAGCGAGILSISWDFELFHEFGLFLSVWRVL